MIELSIYNCRHLISCIGPFDHANLSNDLNLSSHMHRISSSQQNIAPIVSQFEFYIKMNLQVKRNAYQNADDFKMARTNANEFSNGLRVARKIGPISERITKRADEIIVVHETIRRCSNIADRS